ncbi:hypothetical protein ACXR2T_11175 [Leucobacter sp. HY1910]
MSDGETTLDVTVVVTQVDGGFSDSFVAQNDGGRVRRMTGRAQPQGSDYSASVVTGPSMSAA